MQFEQSATAPDLYLAQGNKRAPGSLLYLLPPGSENPPACISFADSWSRWSGAYIFLAAPLAAGTEAAFAAAASAYLADPRMAGARFVWFDPPDLPGLLAGTSIAVYQPAGSGAFATAFQAPIRFADLSLIIPANSPVAIDEAGFAFSFTSPAAAPIRFVTGGGAATVATLAPALILPFAGPFAGCLQLSLEATLQNLADLDAGLRYFYAVPPDPKHPLAPAADFFLESLHYPLFAEDVALYAALDPLDPLDPARSLFAFTPGDAGQPAGAAASMLASCYSSTFGDVFSLQPLAGAALVFAARPQAGATAAGPGAPPLGPRDGLYLVPAGDFALTTSRSANIQLMCGLSGVEYVALGAKTHLTFHPGSPAFATGYFPGESPGYTTLSPAFPPTTAFVTIKDASNHAAAELDYFAQPDQSVLYNNGQTTGSVKMLAPVPVLAATVGEASPHIPFLPYAGLSGQALDSFRQMEGQIASPLRRSRLGTTPPHRAAPAADPSQSSYSATPQGLLATYAPGSPVWQQIVLGQTGQPPQMLRLTNVDKSLLSAFQRNKLFLVVSDPAKIEPYLKSTDAQIVLGAADEPWTFNLDPAQIDPIAGSPVWTQLNTILIVKYYDLSIAQLAGETSTWAFADEFNQAAGDTSAAIAAIIADATQAAAGNSDYAAFLDAVNDPAWNGILMLNVDAPLSNLPPQLAGLAAGIDQSKFYGHHVGIAQSKIDATTGQLAIHNSSVFGLIHYQAPQPLAAGLGDFAFQVEQLKVLFLESDVAGFSATIELEINTLFGEPATLEVQAGEPPNIVKLDGLYHKQMVDGVVHESYTFQTQSGASSTFDMTSQTLNAVQLGKGQFVTVTQPWPIAAAAAVPAGAVRKNGDTTVTTTAPHMLAAGDYVTLSEVDDQSFDGLHQVTSVPGNSSFVCQPFPPPPPPAPPDAASGGGNARPTKTDSRFVFWGLLDFQALPGFDLFSFGREAGATAPAGLSFGNLIIEMTFDSAADPPVPQFAFDVSSLSFDLASSIARSASLFRHFPLTIAGFTQAVAGSAPTDLGFMGVQTPLTQASLGYPWYSLNYNLDLGSPGALAAKAGFVATLTAAWSPAQPGATAPSVFTGLKLPGSSGAAREIALQGIFHITFKTLELLVPAARANTFILVLYNIGFKFLSLTFPPTGQVNFVLFGDPGSPGGNTSLGWYAAYAKPGSGGGGNGGNGGGGNRNPEAISVAPSAARLAPPNGGA